MLLSTILLTLLAPATVHAFPTGAPAEACVDIYPVGHAETAVSQDLGSNPFQIDLSRMDHSHGGSVYYVPGRAYTLTLSGSGGEEFRGFLVQVRTVADGSPVGVFTDNGDDQKLSSCTPEESAVTHPNRDLKSSVTFSWTAPSSGSGQLLILYAVVGEFNESIGHSIFWAPATSDVILLCSPPLYTHQDNCVETCPVKHIGNHTSGICGLFPSDYVMSLNATQYYAYFNSETPINTPAFHVQLSINLSTVPLSDIDDITFRFYQTQLVQELFDFKNGDDDTNILEATDLVESAGDDTGIVDATIVLVNLPDESDYPIELDMTISVTLLYSDNIVESTTAKAVGSIVLAPGACDLHECQNGGTCTDTNSTHFMCDCPPEFTGMTCGEAVNTCQLLEPCVNGTCHPLSSHEYACTCYPGYTGANCNEHICEQLECNNGVCMFMEDDINASCICDPGYTGTVCDEVIRADCYFDGCSGNGNFTVFNGTWFCECSPGWTGMQCEAQILCDPNPCANGATCSESNSTVTCVCTPEWTGIYCETQINTGSVCDENPCANNATCSIGCLSDKNCLSKMGQEYTCQCVPGFTGDTCCEDDPTITFCKPHSCANSGTCIEEYGPSVSCLCTQNFRGPSCAEMISNSDSCSQSSLDGQVVIALICAVASVLIVGMVGTFITIVMTVHYHSKAKAKKFRVSNGLNRERSGRVFTNTNMDTGIYFDTSEEQTGSTVIGNDSLTMSSSSAVPMVTVSGQQTRETPEQLRVTRTFSGGGTMSQTSNLTAVSDYEEPIDSVRRYLQASQSNSQPAYVLSQYETVC